jgi:hypothetical protein
MTQVLSTLKKSGRAVMMALVLGAASVTAMPAPAMAQSFNFEFGIGGGGEGFSFGIGRGGDRIRRDCLTNREIRRGLRRNGFEDIRFVDRRGNRVVVVADFGRRTYRLTINRCTGRVIDVDRIRRGNRPGIGLQFDFGY